MNEEEYFVGVDGEIVEGDEGVEEGENEWQIKKLY